MSALSDEQLEVLADLIAERLAERAAGELITADELARRLGRSREWIYDHSTAFGAVRLGDGARPRLWFRWPAALDRLAELEAPAKSKRAPRVTAADRPRKQRPKASTVELVPVRGSGVRNGGGRRP